MNWRQDGGFLQLPTDWSAEQALAVHGFLLDVSADIWEQ